MAIFTESKIWFFSVHNLIWILRFVWQFPHQLWIMMNFNSTESWLFVNTSFSVLPVVTGPSNKSAMEGYLQRLAHFDEGLYNDFYGFWIGLMVINSLIFLVGNLSWTLIVWVDILPPITIPSSSSAGWHGAQHSRTLCFLFPHQT